MKLKMGSLKINKNTLPNKDILDIAIEEKGFCHHEIKATESLENAIEVYAIKGEMWYGARNYHCIINIEGREYLFKLQIPNKGSIRQKYCFDDMFNSNLDFSTTAYEILVATYHDIGEMTNTGIMIDLLSVSKAIKKLGRRNMDNDVVDSSTYKTQNGFW